VISLFQVLLGQAAELLQPRLDERKQALILVDVDAVWRYVPLTLVATDELVDVGPIGKRQRRTVAAKAPIRTIS